MSNKLAGKVAVITGGNSGIGLATAKRFVEEGAYVFLTGRRQKELDAAVEELGGNAVGVQGDVAKPADLDRLYAIVKAKKGRIDVLYANAGVGEFASISEVTEEHFGKIFDINVKGTLFTVRKALPLMKDGGSIIMTGSVAGKQRLRELRRLQRFQGCNSLLRSHLDERPEGPQDPRERRQPGPDRNADSCRRAGRGQSALYIASCAGAYR